MPSPLILCDVDFSILPHPTIILPPSSELSGSFFHKYLSFFRISSQFFGIMHPRVSGWSPSQFFPFPHSRTSVCSCSKLVALWAEALKDLRAVCSLRHWKSVLLHPPPVLSAKCCVRVNVCCWAGEQMNCTGGSLLRFGLFQGFLGCPASV